MNDKPRPVAFPDPGTRRAGKRRILVTGAHRRVAIELIERLLEHELVELIVAVDRGACPPALLGHDPDRFLFASADLSRRRQVDNLFLLDELRDRPLDTVVHLAFQGDPHGYKLRNHEFNVHATQHLIDGSLRHAVTKFVFLSSDAVYRIGARGDFKVREDAELNHDPKAHPILRDTLDAEFICRAKMDALTCEVMVVRPSGVFGGGVIWFMRTPPHRQACASSRRHDGARRSGRSHRARRGERDRPSAVFRRSWVRLPP